MSKKQQASISPAEIMERVKISSSLNPTNIGDVVGTRLGALSADLAREASVNSYAVVLILYALMCAFLGPHVKIAVSPQHDWTIAARLWAFILACKCRSDFLHFQNQPVCALSRVLLAWDVTIGSCILLAVSGGGKTVIINKAKAILYYVERELQRMAGNGTYESILDSSVRNAMLVCDCVLIQSCDAMLALFSYLRVDLDASLH